MLDSVRSQPAIASSDAQFRELIDISGTTLAIVMHELPHELGDFIVYKKLGLKTRQALALNFLAALVRKGFMTYSETVIRD